MSLSDYYLKRAVTDLEGRVSKVLLNNEEVPIISITNKGRQLIVNTDRVDNIRRINSVKLLDELNNVILERSPNRNTEGSRSLEFRFEIEVE
ncbi:MAG TPA: hypothetical protein DEO65_04355 [Bacillus bacterium]|nr:hypothetical protein [Bacillus sp. (in: firmicutes)]